MIGWGRMVPEYKKVSSRAYQKTRIFHKYLKNRIFLGNIFLDHPLELLYRLIPSFFHRIQPELPF
jgi:hypothetical protein